MVSRQTVYTMASTVHVLDERNIHDCERHEFQLVLIIFDKLQYTGNQIFVIELFNWNNLMNVQFY